MLSERRRRVYLAGQWNEHDNNWKQTFKQISGIEFYDPEIDSDQSSPDKYFPQDLEGIASSIMMVANPGIAPSEATWMEVGYFYALNTKVPGERCPRLIIVWKEERTPKWSVGFIQMAGILVNSIEEARDELLKFTNSDRKLGQ